MHYKNLYPGAKIGDRPEKELAKVDGSGPCGFCFLPTDWFDTKINEHVCSVKCRTYVREGKADVKGG